MYESYQYGDFKNHYLSSWTVFIQIENKKK